MNQEKVKSRQLDVDAVNDGPLVEKELDVLRVFTIFDQKTDFGRFGEHPRCP